MNLVEEFKSRVKYTYDPCRNNHKYRCEKGFFSVSGSRKIEVAMDAAAEFRKHWRRGEYLSLVDREKDINDFLASYLNGD